MEFAVCVVFIYIFAASVVCSVWNTKKASVG